MYRIGRCLVSALASATILSNPLAAQAGGMSHIGVFGGSTLPVTAVPRCGQPGPVGHSPGYHPPSINNSIHIYKPVSITTNIDNSKNINITKNIDNSKNININKSIVINKGSSQADAVAIATAISEASASAVASASAIATALANSNSSSNATINFSAASNNSSNSASVFVGSIAPEAPAAFAGGDIGTLSVEIAPPPAQAQQCTLQEAAVVKAIHAICTSDDGHEFPASHMLGDTWINASYEGEVARCIPGSHLTIVLGKVTQSAEGMAAGTSNGQVLQCAVHEALRHYKDGVLKCAPAVPVPDCTERTNLRRYGTADMFFSYRAKICLESREEYAEQTPSDHGSRQSRLRESGTPY